MHPLIMPSKHAAVDASGGMLHMACFHVPEQSHQASILDSTILGQLGNDDHNNKGDEPNEMGNLLTVADLVQ